MSSGKGLLCEIKQINSIHYKRENNLEKDVLKLMYESGVPRVVPMYYWLGTRVKERSLFTV